MRSVWAGAGAEADDWGADAPRGLSIGAHREAKDGEAVARISAYIESGRAVHRSAAQSIQRLLVGPFGSVDTGGGELPSVEVRKAEILDSHRAALEVVAQLFGKHSASLPEHAQLMAKFVAALYGQPARDAGIDAAAKGIAAVFEALRQRIGQAGADPQPSSRSDVPQSHAFWKIARAGGLNGAAARERWLRDTLPLLDRGRYPRFGGGPMKTASLQDFLLAAWLSLATQGECAVPEMPGFEAIVRRFNSDRTLYFKDAPSWLAYHARYGYEALPDMIERKCGEMAGKAALMEYLGADYRRNVIALVSLHSGSDDDVVRIEAMLRDLEGEVGAVPFGKAGAALMKAQVDYRIQRALAYGAAPIAKAMLDPATTALMAALEKLNGAPDFIEALQRRSMSDRDRALIENAGLVAQVMSLRLAELSRQISTSFMTPSYSAAQMRARLLPALSGMLREAWVLTQLNTLGDLLSHRVFSGLVPGDAEILKFYGVTELDWRIWRAATKRDVANDGQVLTARAIRDVAGFSDADKDSAITMLIAVARSESHRGISGHAVDLDASGELARNQSLNEHYPVAQTMLHLRRGLRMPGRARYFYIAAFMMAAASAGAMSLTVRDLLKSRSPQRFIDSNAEERLRNWRDAMQRSGAIGMYGDLLFADCLDASAHTCGGGMPDSAIWYLRGLVNHALVQNLQEAMNPAYLARMNERAEREVLG